jgi:ethanolaminephosphotransferase
LHTIEHFRQLFFHNLRRFPPVEMTARRGRDGTLSSVLLLAANLLIPAAILVFATGFFPYKPLLPGLATYDAVTEYGSPPEAPFDRLVFMVIDALRRSVDVQWLVVEV